MKAKLSDGSAVVVLIGDMNDPSKSGIRPRVDPFQTHSLLDCTDVTFILLLAST